MKVKVRSSDGDTDYFDIVAGVLQGDTLPPYLFIICLDYMLRMSIDLMKGGTHGAMVIVVGNGHGDSSSNPGREWLHFT